MKVVWTYTRTYNHIEYYFFYPDLYMEWLNIPLRRSRLSGKMETTCPDRRKPL